jgi:hypothetical protein
MAPAVVAGGMLETAPKYGSELTERSFSLANGARLGV